jgi:hypothetical protein
VASDELGTLANPEPTAGSACEATELQYGGLVACTLVAQLWKVHDVAAAWLVPRRGQRRGRLKAVEVVGQVGRQHLQGLVHGAGDIE